MRQRRSARGGEDEDKGGGERKKPDDVWKNKGFVLYYHKEGEPYVEWCQVEKRRMEVERERWKGEIFVLYYHKEEES